MNSVGKDEQVARLLKKCWVCEERISPTAFSLRPGMRETYVSVLRESLPTFREDAIKIVKGKEGTPYATLFVSEVENKKDCFKKEVVSYEVKVVDNNVFKSHAGIFIGINGHCIIGGGSFQTFIKEEGVSESAMLQHIGRALAAIAEKNIKTL